MKNLKEYYWFLKSYFYKRKNDSTKNAKLAMWVWVVWEKCAKRVEKMCKKIMWGNYGKIVENNNMGSVEKL